MGYSITGRQRGHVALGAIAFGLVTAIATTTALDDEKHELRYESERLDISHIREDFYVISVGDTNISVQVGTDGVLLVDTHFRTVAHRVSAAIQSVTELPITHIINSHGHPDHMDGNAYFRQAAADSGLPADPPTILAHEDAVRAMISAGYGEDWLPDQRYAVERMNVPFGDEEITIIHPPVAHTDGDSIVYFPGANIVVVGDLYNSEMYPFVDLWKGGTISGLISALDKIIDIIDTQSRPGSPTLVIASHGGIIERTELVAQRRMIVKVREVVAEMVMHTLSAREIRAQRPTADFDSQFPAGHEFWSADAFVNAVHADIIGTQDE